MPLRISLEGGTTFRRSRMVKMYSPAIGRIKIAGAGRNGTGRADGRAPLVTALVLPRRPGRAAFLSPADYFTWRLTSLVISNIETCFLPPKTAISAPSALIIRRFFLSCRPFFLMYAQSFLVSSVRGRPFEPTTSASFASGVTGRMNAAFGFRFDFFFAAFLAIESLREGENEAGTRDTAGAVRTQSKASLPSCKRENRDFPSGIQDKEGYFPSETDLESVPCVSFHCFLSASSQAFRSLQFPLCAPLMPVPAPAVSTF